MSFSNESTPVPSFNEASNFAEIYEDFEEILQRNGFDLPFEEAARKRLQQIEESPKERNAERSSSNWYSELVASIVGSEDNYEIESTLQEISPRVPDLVNPIQRPENRNDLPLTKTYDCLPNHQPLRYEIILNSSVIQCDQVVDATHSSGSSGTPISPPATSALSKPKRQYTRRYDNEPNIKRLKTTVDPSVINAIASQIPVYKTTVESELYKYPFANRGVCKILLPKTPYLFEPKLVLVHVDGEKFAYRYHTAEDLNTNIRCSILQTSSNPKPPLFWCLECGLSFGRCTTARRHSINIHKNPQPVFKQSHFVKID